MSRRLRPLLPKLIIPSSSISSNNGEGTSTPTQPESAQRTYTAGVFSRTFNVPPDHLRAVLVYERCVKAVYGLENQSVNITNIATGQLSSRDQQLRILSHLTSWTDQTAQHVISTNPTDWKFYYRRDRRAVHRIILLEMEKSIYYGMQEGSVNERALLSGNYTHDSAWKSINEALEEWFDELDKDFGEGIVSDDQRLAEYDSRILEVKNRPTWWKKPYAERP